MVAAHARMKPSQTQLNQIALTFFKYLFWFFAFAFAFALQSNTGWHPRHARIVAAAGLVGLEHVHAYLQYTGVRSQLLVSSGAGRTCNKRTQMVTLHTHQRHYRRPARCQQNCLVRVCMLCTQYKPVRHVIIQATSFRQVGYGVSFWTSCAVFWIWS